MPAQEPCLSFALVDGRPVFMDLRDDHYFVVGPDAETEFLRLLGEGGDGRASPSLRAVLGIGRIAELPPAPCVEPPSSSILDCLSGSAPRVTDLLRTQLLLASIGRALRSLPIAQIAASLANGKAGLAPTDELAGAAIRFAAARRYALGKPNCLVDSLALLRFLGPLASGATLVFGVKLDPFAAHCWVQSQCLLLNDRLDNIERFVAVRTVRCSPATP